MKIGDMAIPAEWLEQVGFDAETEVELVPDEKKLIIREKNRSDFDAEDYRRRLDSVTGILKGQPEDVDRFIEEIRGR